MDYEKLIFAAHVRQLAHERIIDATKDRSAEYVDRYRNEHSERIIMEVVDEFESILEIIDEVKARRDSERTNAAFENLGNLR
jgi:hypothetical protein